MQHFDEIPINQIKKMDGYQTGPQMYADGASKRAPENDVFSETQENNGGGGHLTDEGEDLTMEDRVFHQKWKVRVEAFKEINKYFFSEGQSTGPPRE